MLGMAAVNDNMIQPSC